MGAVAAVVETVEATVEASDALAAEAADEFTCCAFAAVSGLSTTTTRPCFAGAGGNEMSICARKVGELPQGWLEPFASCLWNEDLCSRMTSSNEILSAKNDWRKLGSVFKGIFQGALTLPSRPSVKCLLFKHNLMTA